MIYPLCYDKADHQAVFNRVVEHLLHQGAPASNGRACLYRDASGRRCAIGCLIPDDLYSVHMELLPLHHLSTRFPRIERLFAGIHEDFLLNLQRAHDQWASWVDSWQQLRVLPREAMVTNLIPRLIAVAEAWGLALPPALAPRLTYTPALTADASMEPELELVGA